MSFVIRDQKNFWTGVLYIGVAIVVLWVGKGYNFGTASRMGPGYFPTVLACFLIFFGVLAVIRGIRKVGAPIGTIAWKAAALVLMSTVTFGFLLERAGLPISLVVLVVGSASASEKFRFEWKATMLAIVLIVFCVLVFIKGLGLPMTLLGSWFGS